MGFTSERCVCDLNVYCILGKIKTCTVITKEQEVACPTKKILVQER